MKDDLPSIAPALKALRERTKLSIQDVADQLELSKSGYAHYETDYKKPALPLPLVKSLLAIFSPHGIEPNEVLSLAGASTNGEFSVRLPKEQGIMAKVEEVDARAGAKTGQIDDDGNVVAEWVMPKALLRFATNALPEHIKILTIVGDSMPLSFRPFDKVMVDTSDKIPSPPGIFALWDGLGLVVKRIEYIADTDPPQVRISSENPSYAPYERLLPDAHIQGRVLGKWTWT